MTDAPLLLATTGNFILRYAADDGQRAEIEAGLRTHGGPLAEVLAKLSADELDTLCDTTLATVREGGPLAAKIVDDAEAFVDEAPRQQIDMGAAILLAEGLGILALLAVAVPIAFARLKKIRRLPDGTLEADFYHGMPKELADTLKQVRGRVPAIDQVGGRLAPPDDTPASET